jgi:hypothetical protein
VGDTTVLHKPLSVEGVESAQSCQCGLSDCRLVEDGPQGRHGVVRMLTKGDVELLTELPSKGASPKVKTRTVGE